VTSRRYDASDLRATSKAGDNLVSIRQLLITYSPMRGGDAWSQYTYCSKLSTRQYDSCRILTCEWKSPAGSSMRFLLHITSSLVQISQNLRWQFPYKTTLVAYIATYSLIGS